MADYGDPGSLAAALREGDRVFMVSVHEGYERRVALHDSFVTAAAAAKVAQVVYLSFLNAGPEATFVHARSHGATEEMLERSGIPYVAVRNGMYADGFPPGSTPTASPVGLPGRGTSVSPTGPSWRRRSPLSSWGLSARVAS